MGVCYDNLKNWKQAIVFYERFLDICRQCNDHQGCTLAYHCLGVDHQLMAFDINFNQNAVRSQRAMGDAGLSGEQMGNPKLAQLNSLPGPVAGTTKAATYDAKNLVIAIKYHDLHRAASDTIGQFVAHMNLGACFGHLNNREQCTRHLQQAHKFATYLESVDGQRMAVGNLALNADSTIYADNDEIRQALLEKYLSMPARSPGVDKNSVEAWRKLGYMNLRKEPTSTTLESLIVPRAPIHPPGENNYSRD